MPQTIIDLLNEGTEANNTDKFRRGNVIHLQRQGSLVVTGDIHGHRRNFERIQTFAALQNNPQRHLLLQEIIHGGPQDLHGGCLCFELLFDVVRYKLKFPDRVHIVMGNHDTAFINKSRVMKDGREMNRSMRQALHRRFPQDAGDIELAIRQFLFSQPLAVRTANRIWLSHSLPSERYLRKFDHNILHRKLKINDVVRPGSAYLLTWGRNFSQTLLDKMAELLDADILILGHQPQSQGWARAGQNLIIIASDHNHGCLLPIDLEKSYSIDELIDSLVPLASIA